MSKGNGWYTVENKNGPDYTTSTKVDAIKYAMRNGHTKIYTPRGKLVWNWK